MHTLLIIYRALFKNRGRNYSPPLIKQADKQKTKWQIENGEYCLYIDNEKVNLN